jgi:hypothetical protein
MYLVCHTVNRTARTLLVLVIMLASQGIASVHSYDAFQTDDCLDVCSVCVIGQGLDAAVEACPTVVRLDPHVLQVLFHAIRDRRVSPVNFYFSRAPPLSLTTA